MGGACSSTLVEVQIRGGVRHASGMMGTTQSMIFYLDASKRERVDLQIGITDPGSETKQGKHHEASEKSPRASGPGPGHV